MHPSIIRKIASVFLVVTFFLYPASGIKIVSAASLSGLSNTMSSQKASENSSHMIRFTTPSGAEDSTDTIIVTFPADFNFSSKEISSVTFSHGVTTGLENQETLAATPSSSAWGAVFSGTENRVLTLTAPTDGVGTAALESGHKVIITYDDTNSVNPSSSGSYTINISGTFGDTGSITVNILDDDQVQVSATVSQSITFSISDNSIGFGTLSPSAARYATSDANGSASETEAHNIIVGTNASNGYTVTLSGTTLTSGPDTIDAIGSSNTASSPGSEQFGLRINPSGGAGVVSAPYAASGFAFDSGAFPDEVAGATGASDNTTYSVRYLANISALTEAGEYTAQLTYVTSANF